MTRIVQLANFYGPGTGGLKIVLEELARCYSAAGLERVLIAPGPSDTQETGQHGTRISVRAPVLPGSGGYRMILRSRHLLELLDRVNPDVVEVSDKLTLVAAARWARQRGIPCTLLSHERIDAILRERVPGFVPLARFADAWNAGLARTFDAVICPSRFAYDEFRRIGAANATVVPWGVDLETFSPSSRVTHQSEAPARRSAVELICVGRLSREKEPGLAVDVAAELHRRGLDVHLTMVGAGPMSSCLRRRSHGLPVTFTGHIDDRGEIARLLRAADVTLAPSGAESFGLAALESLACGTPVVTSESGAGVEVCGKSCGMAAPPDAGKMADAVSLLLALDREGIRARARARAELFPWTSAAESVLAVHLGRALPVRGA
jgi:alpha-1,6-mannosyltransferase